MLSKFCSNQIEEIISIHFIYITYSLSILIQFILKCIELREQDGRGVGGCGVHLSPWIHQEYTFRHRSACRITAENRQQDLTSGKEYIESCKTVG